MPALPIRRWTLLSLVVLFSVLAPNLCLAETLYNGIVLPSPWPPTPTTLNHCYPLNPTPSYLTSPPAVIPINVGRQLFVDNFLIQNSTLTQTHHQPAYYSGNPILSPNGGTEGNLAMPYSDGVWYEPNLRKFRMYYDMRGVYTGVVYSNDGLRFTRPTNIGSYVGTSSNVVSPLDLSGQVVTSRDSAGVWLDLRPGIDPNQRYRMTYYRCSLHNALSSNGINFRISLVGDAGYEADGHPSTWDRSTFFYNPFRDKWVYSHRYHLTMNGIDSWRARKYCELYNWTVKMPAANTQPWWWCSDTLDLPDPRYNKPTELYNLDVVPYESLMIGMFSIWHGDSVEEPDPTNPNMVLDQSHNRPKLNSVNLGYSRDGWYWSRPDRRPWLNYSEVVSAWNYGNIQTVLGSFMAMGDTLYVYCSGRNGTGNYAGLAFMRRDGFVSLDANSTPGDVTTRTVSFQGSHLFVNVADPNGTLVAEVQDEAGNPIAPFTLANCVPVSTDSTIYEVTWNGAADLSSLASSHVRLHFRLTNGSLYSFWVSPSSSGASNGYPSAGGPGYVTNCDTVGKAAYAAAYVLNQVNAGSDANIRLPAVASLTGSVSNSGLPAGQTWTPSWTVTSGPGIVTFGNPHAAATTATFSQPGTYLLRLNITDGWMNAWGEVKVTAAQVLKSDFNHDNQVDGLDFLIWQAAYPKYSGATPEDGDANGDGAVDGLDFLQWQVGFGKH
jgi:hypothetical protein